MRLRRIKIDALIYVPVISHSYYERMRLIGNARSLSPSFTASSPLWHRIAVLQCGVAFRKAFKPARSLPCHLEPDLSFNAMHDRSASITKSTSFRPWMLQKYRTASCHLEFKIERRFWAA